MDLNSPEKKNNVIIPLDIEYLTPSLEDEMFPIDLSLRDVYSRVVLFYRSFVVSCGLTGMRLQAALMSLRFYEIEIQGLPDDEIMKLLIRLKGNLSKLAEWVTDENNQSLNMYVVAIASFLPAENVISIFPDKVNLIAPQDLKDPLSQAEYDRFVDFYELLLRQIVAEMQEENKTYYLAELAKYKALKFDQVIHKVQNPYASVWLGIKADLMEFKTIYISIIGDSAGCVQIDHAIALIQMHFPEILFW